MGYAGVTFITSVDGELLKDETFLVNSELFCMSYSQTQDTYIKYRNYMFDSHHCINDYRSTVFLLLLQENEIKT